MATAAEVEFWKDMCRKESARNNKLWSEWDKAIRQQLAADDARKTAEAVANGLEWEVEELASENAKLRELVRALVCATDPHDRERLIINAVELLGEVGVDVP